MLAWWWELLPLFLVRLAAKGGCERISVNGSAWCTARRDVIVKLIEDERA